jgi:hypothetical protein
VAGKNIHANIQKKAPLFSEGVTSDGVMVFAAVVPVVTADITVAIAVTVPTTAAVATNKPPT